MKVQEFDGLKERKVLAGMIFDPVVLAEVSSLWREDGHPFPNDIAGSVGKMAVDHWRQFSQPPGRQGMQVQFLRWGEQHRDEASISLVEDLLVAVCNEHDFNGKCDGANYTINLISEFFNKTRVEKTAEKATGLVGSGNLEEAIKVLDSFSRVEMGKMAGTHLFIDRDEVFAAFSEEEGKPLIPYEGDLGKFLGTAFCRSNFVSLIGKEGIGKTWWLVDFAWNAMVNRQRVAFFEIGDLSRKQIEWRFLTRAAEKPRWPCMVSIPVSMRAEEVDHEEREFLEPLQAAEAWAACNKVMKWKVKSKRSFFYLETHPASTVTVADIRSSLERQMRSGFVPDVVLIDYADILAPSYRKMDFREAINENWKQMRSLSLEMDVLLVTATQANRLSYGSKSIKMEHASDDKRKIAYVTHMIGMTAMVEEKERQCVKFNMVKDRDNAHGRDVRIAGCLALGHPSMLSNFVPSPPKIS